MNLCTIHEPTLAARPDTPYLVVDDETITYADLHRRALADARALARLGVRRGDRVALFMDNRTDIAPLYFACFRIGAVSMPVSCFDTAHEAAYSLANCGAETLIVEAELAGRIAEIREKAPGLRRVFTVGGGEGGSEEAPSWEAERARSGPEPEVEQVDEDHPAAILYTSGSTGKPKGVTHTHGSLLHNGEGRIAAFGHEPGDTFLIHSKLCHGAGLGSQLVTLAMCGGTTVAMRSHAAAKTHSMMLRHRPTFVGTSPADLRAMLADPSFDPAAYAGLKALYVGGDKAPLDLYELFHEKTGLDLREALGMTECGGYMNCRPDMRPKPGSAGVPIPGTEVRIVDAQGRGMEPGQDGELILRSRAVMAGYWGEPEITARTIRNGWLHTGDLARVDEDGYYFITGRIKDIIIRGTGNISPAEVESAMIEHPGVAQCGVFGIPDGTNGQAVVAAVVPADPADPPGDKSLSSFAATRLAERRIPQHWMVLDALPLTEGMRKVDRTALKALWDERTGTA